MQGQGEGSGCVSLAQAQQGVLLCCRARLRPALHVYTCVCNKGLHADVGGDAYEPPGVSVRPAVDAFSNETSLQIRMCVCFSLSPRVAGRCTWQGCCSTYVWPRLWQVRQWERAGRGLPRRVSGCWWVRGSGAQGRLPPPAHTHPELEAASRHSAGRGRARRADGEQIPPSVCPQRLH